MLFFLKIDDDVHALINQLLVDHHIKEDFQWIESAQIRRLLQDPAVFTHYYAIHAPASHWLPGIIRLDQIKCKMIFAECKNFNYLMPLYAFEHN